MKDFPNLKNFPQLKAFSSQPRFISLIGHRGARGLMPENTIKGFDYLVKNGVTAVEFDVLLTKDGVPVITHDYCLSKAITRDAAGKWLLENGPRISELTFAELAQFDVGGLDKESPYGMLYPEQAFFSGIRIPRLSQLFDLACQPKGQNLYLLLEIKSEAAIQATNIVQKIVFEIEQRSLSSRTVLHSFDWNILQECARLAPAMSRSYLSQLPESTDDPFDSPARDISPDFSSLTGSIPEAVFEAGGHMWCPYFKDVTLELVQDAHKLGLIVCAWTVNELHDFKNMIDIGVDGIITDYPDRAKSIFKANGLKW